MLLLLLLLLSKDKADHHSCYATVHNHPFVTTHTAGRCGVDQHQLDAPKPDTAPNTCAGHARGLSVRSVQIMLRHTHT